MPYTAEISRTSPSCFLFLIDQSGSMEDDWGGEPGKQKADGLATIINRLLQNLVLKCAKSEGVRDYYHVGVLGFGHNVGPAFSGPLAGRELVPISEIANSPARIEERTRKVDDGAGGLVDQTVKFPVWFDPVAKGGTPMRQVLGQAQNILSGWIAAHPDGFPPIVVNITDGESTDGDPTEPARALMDLTTSDGNTLLFNVHVSSQQAQPVQFPDTEDSLPDQYAKLLFNMSSTLPGFMRGIAQQEGFQVSDGAHGFVFNGDMVSVIQFLDIGTRPSNLR
ncbi:MAG: VWA domain-containing protein [Chloroflexota bacterium]|nr:VWA domain-containing protein [Chloroflexota bacterium]